MGPDPQECRQPFLDRRCQVRVDHRRADQPDAERIYRLTALPNLEMKMRPGRQPARADIADQLAGVDEAPRLGDDLAHMAVAG